MFLENCGNGNLPSVSGTSNTTESRTCMIAAVVYSFNALTCLKGNLPFNLRNIFQYKIYGENFFYLLKLSERHLCTNRQKGPSDLKMRNSNIAEDLTGTET